jgi:putative glycosyltransferase (exosortase G-associated)
MNSIYASIIFWIVWLLVPILINGITIVFSFVGAMLNHRKKPIMESGSNYPLISIVIPIKNGAKTLEACVRSIAAQNYPKEKMEIMVIDNGSTDQSFDVFNSLIDIEYRMTWHSIIGKGKAWALNSGIYLSQAHYFINVDCDLILAPNAILNAIAYMEKNEDVGAATGYLVISPPESDSAFKQLLGKLEFLEYVTVFGVGRAYQSQTNSLFTLSGAFSIFRREVLLQTFLYNQDTVSEDTELTLQLYTKANQFRVVTIQNAIAYLHPIESLYALYSQRVRWQRGELEASALHLQLLKEPLLRIQKLSLKRILLVDHTLALPRLIWLIFLPILTGFGYSPSMIFFSYILMYLFYLFIEVLWIGTAYLYAAPEIQKEIIGYLPYITLMPIYRISTFFFRVAGFISAITEPFSWTAPNPIEQTKEGLKEVKEKVIVWVEGMIAKFQEE